MMFSMNRVAFLQHIYMHWADQLGNQVRVITRRGTTVLPQTSSDDQYPIQLWLIGDHAFLSVHPCAAPYVALDQWSPTHTVSLPDLRALLHPDCTFTQSTRQLAYLYPPDLPHIHVSSTMALRSLTSGDAAHLHLLQYTASPADVHVSDVQLAHAMIVGGFVDEKLVAVASASEQIPFHDIGVLTHPAFRGRGFGLAVVHAVCTRSVAGHHIVQYCYNVMNHGSRGIAKRLQFTHVGHHIRLKIHAPEGGTSG